MFEKTKEFCKEHKAAIIVAGGAVLTVGTCIIIGKSMKRPINVIEIPEILERINNYDGSQDRAILEGFGAIYKDGYGVPFATKEVATKFLEERGKTYQLDILDDLTSIIWISQ